LCGGGGDGGGQWEMHGMLRFKLDLTIEILEIAMRLVDASTTYIALLVVMDIHEYTPFGMLLIEIDDIF
jgi:hypothetical protein